MRLQVERLHHAMQRYDTCGDWMFEEVRGETRLKVYVSMMWRFESELAVALHEVVEALLCRRAGITTAMVDAWDMAHPHSDDPGGILGCPYWVQHNLATIAERFFCRQVELPWATHEEVVDKCADEAIKGTPGRIWEGDLPDVGGIAVLLEALRGKI